MDQSTPATTTSAPDGPPSAATTATAQPPHPSPQQHPPQSQPASSLPPPSQPTPNPNPNPVARPSTPLAPQPQPSRPHQAFPRPLWQHPHFHHFSSSPSPSAPSTIPVSSAVSPSVSASQTRAHPTSSFSSSFRQQQQQFGGLGRGLPEPNSTTTTSQARPGVQGMGMVGSMSSSQRPGGIGVASPHNPRPVQSALRPPHSLSSSPSPVPQNFQGHGFMRPSSGGPSPAQPSTSQSPNQPWMSSGRPPLPSPAYRPQTTAPSLPPRSITAQLQQQQSLSSNSPQQQQAPRPQQHLASHQHPDLHEQQVSPSKFPQSTTQPQPMARGQGAGSQKAASPSVVQPNAVQSVAQSMKPNAESDESNGRILSKRTIHELVSQIDPSERLDSEVEDILADIADEFVESITTFGCSLAKHRKSDRLEAKDILLHVEKNWNITLPGFSGDEIKTYRKPIITDIHKERLAAIKKSVLASDMANAKNPVGQVVSNAKNNQTKTPASAILSPNLKAREVS